MHTVIPNETLLLIAPVISFNLYVNEICFTSRFPWKRNEDKTRNITWVH